MPPAGTHPSRSGKCLRWPGPRWLGRVGTRPGEASPAPDGGRVPAECGGLASPTTCLGCAQGSGWVANRALDVQKCRSARGERPCLSRKSPHEPALPGVMCWASSPGPLSSDQPVVGGGHRGTATPLGRSPLLCTPPGSPANESSCWLPSPGQGALLTAPPSTSTSWLGLWPGVRARVPRLGQCRSSS